MRDSNNMLNTSAVAATLGVSVSMCRMYKNTCIIEPNDTKGNQDLYDRNEIKWVKRRLQQLRSNHSLKQISSIIGQERATRRQVTAG